ncbi:MAG TPA: hypothetical protein VFZ58_00500 [Candidatus Saccharimonadales bacterium]
MRLHRFFYRFGVMVVAALLAVPSAYATTFLGENGRIAYTVSQRGAIDLRLMQADGSHDYLVARGAKHPVWSPNGQKLAYILQGQLFTMHVNGVKKCLTCSSAVPAHSPAWSADGKWLAFVRTVKAANGQPQSAIFTTKSSSANEQNITGWLKNGEYNSPSFSPDGTRLVYEKRAANTRQLYIKNLAMNYERLLTSLSDDVDSRVSFSPNGKKILFNDSANEIYTIWPDGSHRSVISDGDSYQASFSPNGDRVVFLEDPSDASIGVSGPDGSVSYLLIDTMGYQTIGTPQFSPDGQKLLFTLSSEQTSALFSLELGKPDAQPLKLATGLITEASWQAIK